MLRAVLFDLGDTLIDFEPMDTRAVFRMAAGSTYDFLAQRGHALPPFEEYCRRQHSTVKWAYFWAKIKRKEFNSMRLLGDFCARLGAHLSESELTELAWLWYVPLIQHSSAEAVTADVLTELRDAGLKVGLVSNTFIAPEIHDRHLEMLNLLNLIPVRVYSSEVGHRKPDSRIFQIALDRLGVSAADTAFVGDLVKTDIVGARRMGMKTILKQPWGSARSHQKADVVIRSIAELPSVLEIADSTNNYRGDSEVAAA